MRALQLLVAALALAVAAARAGEPPIALSNHCPPSFEKTAAGVCELRTLYQFYDSLENRGVGGTRTALPPHRDGYTPQLIDLGRYLFFDPVLSGALPFTGDDGPSLLRKHVKARPLPLGEVVRTGSVSPALARLVMSCLEKSPFHRPELAERIVAALLELG